MCLDFTEADAPFRRSKTRTFFKVVHKAQGEYHSSFYDHTWTPGENRSLRTAVELSPYEIESRQVDNGFHVYTRAGLALDILNTGRFVIAVQCHDDDCVQTSKRYHEAVYTKVFWDDMAMNYDEFVRFLKASLSQGECGNIIA